MQDEPHTLRINQSSLLTPPAVIKHQAEQIANARRRAAEGSLAPYAIPLLANTQTRSSKNRVTWTLKFTLPQPAEAGTTRRFSAVPRGYGPSGAHALEGAVRYAYPFDYQHEATTLLPDSDFLSLPDHVTQYGPVRAQTLGLHIPESIKAWLLSGAPRIYDRRDLELPGNRQIALPSILMRYFCSELTIQQFEALLRGKQAENDKALDAAATECRRMKRPKQALARLPHPAASSASISAPLAPAPLGNTPPPSPRIPDTERSRTPPPDRPRPIGMVKAADQWPVTLLRIPWAKAKALPQAPKGMIPHGTQRHLFSRFHPKKVTTLPPKGERKARIRARTKVDIKARAKAKVRTKKVDWPSSPPFRLVLGRSLTSSFCLFACLSRSCPRSPPFRSVRGRSTLTVILHYILIPLHHHFGEKVLSPALHHLGWPWLRTLFSRIATMLLLPLAAI